VNFANALSKMKDNLVRLLVSNVSRHLLTALVLAITAGVEAVRPDRSCPRNIKLAKLQGFYPKLQAVSVTLNLTALYQSSSATRD